MGILFIPMFCVGIVMYIKAPKLLQSRLNAKEAQSEQRNVIKYSGIMFVVAFIVAGLNYRFRWTLIPETFIYIAICFFAGILSDYSEANTK